MVAAKELVDERRAALSDDVENDGGVYLTYLLSNDNISLDEIYSNVMEMLFAGTDTVRLHCSDTLEMSYSNVGQARSQPTFMGEGLFPLPPLLSFPLSPVSLPSPPFLFSPFPSPPILPSSPIIYPPLHSLPSP